jgi:hypothetical protein
LQARQVAEVVSAHFLVESAEKKVIYFFILNEIFLRSKD